MTTSFPRAVPQLGRLPASTCLLCCLLLTTINAAELRINEIDADQTGTDNAEFIELYDGGSGQTDVSNYVVVLFNGNGDTVSRAFSLTGLQTNAAGYFVLGNTGVNGVVVSFPANTLQNGADAVALYKDRPLADFSVGSSLISIGQTGLIDAIVYDTNDADDPGLLSLLNPGQAQINENGRGSKDTHSSQRIPNGSGGLRNTASYDQATPTPNAANTISANPVDRNILINEIDADQAGSDATEFIELYDGGRGNISLDGLIIVLYNGSDDGVYSVIDLDGHQSNSDGYFVIGNAAVPNVGLVRANNFLQNGPDAVALFARPAADFSNDDLISTDDLLDAIVYDTDDDDDAGLLPLLLADEVQVDEDGGGNQASHSLQRLPNGSGGQRRTGSYTPAPPTPGAENSFPFADATIAQIQGAAHRSPLLDQRLRINQAIVTAVASNGFYMQDPVGDGNDATSEGLFVFTSAAPAVAVGDAVSCIGAVSEFTPGGPATGNLSITQVFRPQITILSTGNDLPAAMVIGRGGRKPPTAIIDNDNLSSFDPAEDGIDFYEALEGMRVRINQAVVIGSNRFGDIHVLGDRGREATGRTTRKGIHIRQTDFNPERLIIDDALTADPPTVEVGDAFKAPIIGVVSYSFGNFKILNSAPLPERRARNLRKERTRLRRGFFHLTMSSYNVLNLDGLDPQEQFDAHAQTIVHHLRSPDIVALQEVQDNNGAASDPASSDASITAQRLLDAIRTAGGPTDYRYVDIAPAFNQDGGQPGGNIRVAYLYRSARVRLAPGSSGDATTPVQITATGLSLNPGRVDPGNAAFANSRKALAAQFRFRGRDIFVINVHFSSKGGDDPLFGARQPPIQHSLADRIRQAAAVETFVRELLERHPAAMVCVLGDHNDFEFSDTLDTLTSGALTNLIEAIPLRDRFTFIFNGNSQTLDHASVSPFMKLIGRPRPDIVHCNAGFADFASDHDPLVLKSFVLPHLGYFGERFLDHAFHQILHRRHNN